MSVTAQEALDLIAVFDAILMVGKVGRNYCLYGILIANTLL